MKKYQLKDLALNITDGKHGDCQNEDKSGYYFISCKDVKDGNINYEAARQITQKDYLETHKRTLLQPDDILITNSGTIGRMAFIKDVPETYRTTFQKSVAIIKPDTLKVLPKYLYYQLLNNVASFVSQSNGAAQKNLLLSTMRAFEINIHEKLETQKHIADILSAYDDLIENNQKQIKLLEEAAQRLYKEWFVDLHFPGYENTKIVDGVPEGWEKEPINKVGNIITGKTPSTSNKEYYGNEVPFVKIPDMHGKIYPIETELKLSKSGAGSQKNKYLPPNSIVVSCIATVGLVCITCEECQTNQQINAVVLDDKVNLYYVYFCMKDLEKILDGLGSNGATMTNVNKEKFGKIEIALPSRCLVEEYNTITEPIFKKILLLEKQSNGLQGATSGIKKQVV